MARRIAQTELFCIHRHPLFVLEDTDAPGICVYLHRKEGENAEMCIEMNTHMDVEGDEDEHGIAYLQSLRFGNSPEFRAGFLTSLEVRKRVYGFIAKLKDHTNVEQSLRLIVALLNDAWNAEAIYAELYGVFGLEEVRTNIRLACGNIQLPSAMPKDIGISYQGLMFDLKSQRIKGVQEQIEEDAQKNHGKVRKAQEYAQSKINRYK